VQAHTRARRLRHIKIIMLSAKGRDAEVSKGLSMGADIYVTKPFSTRELMDKIKGCSTEYRAVTGVRRRAGPALGNRKLCLAHRLLHRNIRAVVQKVEPC